MASIFDTRLDGLNKTNAALSGNRAVSTVRSAGTSSNYNAIAISRPNELDGDMNDGINTAMISASPNIGYGSGSSIGAADEIRKQIETTISNANYLNSDVTHDKVADRQTITTGYVRLRNGTLVDAAGNAVTPTGISTNFEITASAGDEPTLGRSTAQSYNYRMALTNVDKSLDTRTG